MLYSHGEETEQDQLQWWISVPSGQQVPPFSWRRLIVLHASLCGPAEGPCPHLLQRTDIVMELSRCHMMHMLKQDDVRSTYRVWNRKTFSHIRWQVQHRLWGLYLVVRKCARPKPIHMAEWVSKDCMRETTFPNR